MCLAQEERVLMSDWMIEMSDGSLMGQERRISSAYRMTVEGEEKSKLEDVIDI